MPRVINEIIGINAALEILSLLQATNKSQSYSLSVDGLSQSSTTPGPQVYQARIDFLLKKKDGLVKKIKNTYGGQIFTDYF